MKKDKEEIDNTSLIMRGTLHQAIRERVSRSGNTIYVDGTYQGDERGSEQKPYSTISEALNHAIADNTIIVRPGIYQENIKLEEKVRLLSQITGAAIIYGGATRFGGRPTITGVNNSELIGFTVMGGNIGVLCDGTSPIIRHNIIRGNYGDYGLACLNRSEAIIHNNTLTANLGSEINGLSMGLFVENANPIIYNNIITGNNTGYVTHQCSPFERYNDIWGNRQNFGHGTQPNRRSISVKPKFVDPSEGNYQLQPDSQCRQSGRNIEDKSLMNMGAFDAKSKDVTEISWTNLSRVTQDAFNAFPYINHIQRRLQEENWGSAFDEQLSHYWAMPGDEIILQGLRLQASLHTTHEWGMLQTGNIGLPIVYFGNVRKVIELHKQPATPPQDSNLEEIKTQVPLNAVSGWVFVQIKNLESNPLYLEIRRP